MNFIKKLTILTEIQRLVWPYISGRNLMIYFSNASWIGGVFYIDKENSWLPPKICNIWPAKLTKRWPIVEMNRKMKVLIFDSDFFLNQRYSWDLLRNHTICCCVTITSPNYDWLSPTLTTMTSPVEFSKWS